MSGTFLDIVREKEGCPQVAVSEFYAVFHGQVYMGEDLLNHANVKNGKAWFLVPRPPKATVFLDSEDSAPLDSCLFRRVSRTVRWLFGVMDDAGPAIMESHEETRKRLMERLKNLIIRKEKIDERETIHSSESQRKKARDDYFRSVCFLDSFKKTLAKLPYPPTESQILWRGKLKHDMENAQRQWLAAELEYCRILHAYGHIDFDELCRRSDYAKKEVWG